MQDVKNITQGEQGDNLRTAREATGLGREGFAGRLALENTEKLKSLELGKTKISGPILKLLQIEFGISGAFITKGVGEIFTDTPETIASNKISTICANKHMRNVIEWLNKQRNDERYWGWISLRMEKEYGDFAEFLLKKRQRESLGDNTPQKHIVK
ncbi:hypothetical protein KAR10_04100 [bacterium]|nr:hypothetical protein [bacterium]